MTATGQNKRLPLEDKIKPATTALIVIDIQNDFASPDLKFFAAKRGRDFSEVRSMLDKLEAVIPVAEKAGVLIIYTKQVYDRDKLNALQKEQYDLDGKSVTAVAGSEGAEFYKIKPLNDNVFIKYNYNIFSNRKLTETLEKKGIKTLVIAGMDTIFCVENAVRFGFDLGYKIVLAKDLIAGNGKYKDWNRRTLDITDYTFGTVVSSDSLIKIWKSES